MDSNRRNTINYDEKANGIEWKAIGEVSKMYDVDTARLRDWCNKGLVGATKTSSGRKIPETEFQKIKRIIEIFDSGKDRGVRVTFEDVKEELQKDDLFRNHLNKVQKQKEHKNLEQALSDVFQKIGLDKSLFGLAEKVNSIQSQLNKQTHLLEDEETKKKRQKQIDQMQEDINEIKKMYQNEQKKRHESEEQNRQLQDELHSIQSTLSKINCRLDNEGKKQEKTDGKGFFARLFKS